VLLRRAEQLRVDEVACGWDESQQRPREHARQRERQRHAQERLDLAGVQVLRGLDQAPVDLLQRDVQRQRHEGQEVVGDPRHHGRRGGEQAPVVAEHVQVAQRLHDETLVGQDVLPGQRADQIRDEERRDDRQQQQVLPASAAECDPVRQRVADHEREHGRDPGVDERADQVLVVGLDRVPVVRELPRELEAEVERPALE
jgi:hypothetical protein